MKPSLNITLLIIIILYTLGSCTSIPKHGSIQHDGVTRTFIYYVPRVLYETSVPLVFMLHGGGGSSNGTINNLTEGRLNELANTNKFIVVYPQGLNNRWNDCRSAYPVASEADDVGFFDAMIAWFSAHYPIDPKRVYAAGHSNGGMMCMRLALELSDKIAAICTSAGPLAADSICPNPTNPISIMYLAGTADPLVPFDGGTASKNRGTVLSAKETVDFWVEFLGTDTTPAVTNLPNIVTTDDSTITIYTYFNGFDETEVLFYQINGGGHGWPSPTQFSPTKQLIAGKRNQDIIACDEAWTFFQRHTLGQAQKLQQPQ